MMNLTAVADDPRKIHAILISPTDAYQVGMADVSSIVPYREANGDSFYAVFIGDHVAARVPARMAIAVYPAVGQEGST